MSCSPAELISVSIEHYKIQSKKLYLQPVKKSSHLPSGYKLLLPYITNKPCFVYTDNKDLLFYNGYAILANSEDELLLLQKILMSKIFWFYIVTTSKPYAGSYYSVAKNYIKNFGVCDLSENEKQKLIKMNDKDEIDKFLANKYDLNLIHLTC